MTELSAPFAPDWVLPPGETILEIAEERGWTEVELGRRLGYSETHVSQLVNGEVPVTKDVAQRLEQVLGSSLDFWLSLETNFQTHLARLEAEPHPADWEPRSRSYPIRCQKQ